MLDFPNTPTTGQKYPATPVAGTPTYTWDGQKWTTIGGAIAGKTPVYSDGTVPMTAQLTVVDPPVAPTNAASKNYVDGIATSANASISNRVRWDAAQGLTSPQATQGRINVYAAPFDALAYKGMQINGSMEVSQERSGNASPPPNGPDASVTAGYRRGPAQWPSSGLAGLLVILCRDLAACSICKCQRCRRQWALVISGPILQRIEGWRVARLQWGTANAQPLTLGFWTSRLGRRV